MYDHEDPELAGLEYMKKARVFKFSEVGDA
jgi:hypothetical protein